MRKFLWVLSTWLAIVSMAAHAGHEVEVLDTYPAGDRVEIAPGQKFYLRVAYATDSMTRVFARPYANGREVRALNSPSPSYRGSGETAVWFSFTDEDDTADEIRIFTGNGGGVTRRQPALIHRVSVAGSATAAAAPPAPAWVATLEDSVVAATGGPQPPATAAEGDWLVGFMVVVLGLALFGLVAPIWCFRRWRGGWRIAAAVPMVAMGLFVAFLLLAALFDPGSLGLLPFVVLMAAVPCSLAIVALFLARKLTGADRREAA